MQYIIALLVGSVARAIWEAFDVKWTDIKRACIKYRIWPICEHCRSICGLRLESSRTRYPFDGEWDSKNDPNRHQLLCRRCAEHHHEHWDDMWADYNAGRL